MRVSLKKLLKRSRRKKNDASSISNEKALKRKLFFLRKQQKNLAALEPRTTWPEEEEEDTLVQQSSKCTPPILKETAFARAEKTPRLKHQVIIDNLEAVVCTPDENLYFEGGSNSDDDSSDEDWSEIPPISRVIIPTTARHVMAGKHQRRQRNMHLFLMIVIFVGASMLSMNYTSCIRVPRIIMPVFPYLSVYL